MIHIVNAAPALAGAYFEANAQPMLAWRNLMAEGTIASASLPATNPRANAATEDTASFWGATGADTLSLSLASAEDADLCLIAAHELGSDGRSITLQYLVGATWTTIATVTPADNHPFMILFPRVSSDGYRVTLSGASVVGVVWIGPRVVIPGGVVPGYSEIWASREITKLGGGTRSGHWLGQRVERVTAQLAPTLMPVDYDFARDDLADFRTRYNEGRAFVWASAPAVFPYDVAYAWATDGAVFQPVPHAGGELCDLSLKMGAYCEP